MRKASATVEGWGASGGDPPMTLEMIIAITVTLDTAERLAEVYTAHALLYGIMRRTPHPMKPWPILPGQQLNAV